MVSDPLPPRLYSDLIGRPFRAGGRGPDFDCYGLVWCVLERNGIQVPDYPSNENPAGNAALILAAMESGWQKIQSPEAGSVVLLRIEMREGTHVGVMLDRLRFLHVMKDTKSVIEKITSDVWKRRVLGFYKWKVA